MAELGPYRTDDAPQPLRTAYWLLAVFGSGGAGILADRALGPRISGLWTRIAVVSIAITPPVTVLVYALNAVCSGCRGDGGCFRSWRGRCWS
jgi:hypothetical protein